MTSALELKKRNPQRDIFVLYRDIRTYGRREALYLEARRQGVVFIRYSPEEKPVVEPGEDGIRVTVRDPTLNRRVQIEAGLLVLAAAVVPRRNEELIRRYKLACNEEGFFMEAHAKLRPVDFATDGIFMAGMAHAPKPLEESIAQAQAAASRAAGMLSKSVLKAEGIVSRVDERLCRACGECESACPYGAVTVQETRGGRRAASVQAVLCKGCGSCAAVCPSGAASLGHYDDRLILATVAAAAGDVGRTRSTLEWAVPASADGPQAEVRS
jgi:heterodisulfide reductase subunit A